MRDWLSDGAPWQGLVVVAHGGGQKDGVRVLNLQFRGWEV